MRECVAAAVVLFSLALPELVRAQTCRQDAECRALAALASRPAVERAFAYLERSDAAAVRELIELTQIPAPPFQETARARRFAELLSAGGADSVWIDSVGNVLALRRGARPGSGRVAVAGHLDTVFPEGTDVTVRQRGDTLFAPGIGDDTRGLIVVLQLLRALVAADLRTPMDVLFVGTVGEEGLGDLRGVKHLFRNGGDLDIRSFIAIDGGSDARIVHRALGSRRFRVSFQGTGGHSWSDFGAPNPAHALGAAIRRFDEAARPLSQPGVVSYNVGRMGGGTSVNSIPFEAWMEVDIRSEDPARIATIETALRAAVDSALATENAGARRGSPLRAAVEALGDRPSGVVPDTTPLVRRSAAATRWLGVSPELTASSTDANLPISLGIPAVTLGRGGVGDGGHSPGEWWLNRNGARSIQRTLLVLLAEAGVGAGAR